MPTRKPASASALWRFGAALPLGVLGASAWPAPAYAGPCPAVVVTVDNDADGSGYSEQSPENWKTHNVDACKGTYRYLSKYVGDGSTDGKAVWQPAISISGLYEVVTSFRATGNRTDDADYVLYDDYGGKTKKVVDQTDGSGCTKKSLGTIYCAVGGSCRLVLDGTDDEKSDSADVTTFTLVACDVPDAGMPGPCDGIAQNPAYELCEQSLASCAGVFTDGSGCAAFCAAANMTCVARFGGEPGCSKEADNPIPCDADNGHASDYCECAAPPAPDGGAPADDAGSGGGAAGDAGPQGGGAPDAGASGGGPGTGGAGGGAGSGASAGDTGGFGSDGAGLGGEAVGGGSNEAAAAGDSGGGCGCAVVGGGGARLSAIWMGMGALAALVACSRRRAPIGSRRT